MQCSSFEWTIVGKCNVAQRATQACQCLLTAVVFDVDTVGSLVSKQAAAAHRYVHHAPHMAQFDRVQTLFVWGRYYKMLAIKVKLIRLSLHIPVNICGAKGRAKTEQTITWSQKKQTWRQTCFYSTLYEHLLRPLLLQQLLLLPIQMQVRKCKHTCYGDGYCRNCCCCCNLLQWSSTSTRTNTVTSTVPAPYLSDKTAALHLIL